MSRRRPPVAPAPGPHGGDAAALAAALGIDVDGVLDLSASLNPFAPDLSGAVARHAATIRHYPDDRATTATLASVMRVDPDRLVLTNGGAEAIALVAAELPTGWVDEPDFSLYRRHLTRVERGAPVWRSNPHNPTGQLAPPTARAGVWDEAFYPLTTGTWTRGDPGAIVVGSLTKLFACPGLRAGYVLAPDAGTARRLRRRRPEWSVNALACAVLPNALAAADPHDWSVRIAAARAELESALRATGLHPDPSDTCFVLVRDAPGLREHLARVAVLVRDTRSFGIDGGVRVAVPAPADLARLRRALEGYRR